MRIIVIGATGVIGTAVADALSAEGHDVLRASRHGVVRVDIEEPASIQAMFGSVGTVDAVVSCAGRGAFRPVTELTDKDLELTVRSKLMGQVNLVRFGVDNVSDGGVFVLTSGIFSREPIPGVPALALANGALESFGRAAALDLPRSIRINVICPPFIKETAERMGMEGGLPATQNARAYAAVIASDQTGEVVVTGEWTPDPVPNRP